MADPEKTLNILSVWPERLWRTKQSPSRRFYVRALAARHDVQLIQTGPGFVDWDNDKSGLANIQRIMPDCHAVLSYKTLGGCEYGRINDPAELSQNVLTIEQFNECWAGTSEIGGVLHPGANSVAEYCISGHVQMAVIHHENDRQRVAHAESCGTQVVHIPHCAHTMFRDAACSWNERSGIILTGSLNSTHYPLRRRWHDLIKSGRIRGEYFHRPSNYTDSPDASDDLVRRYADTLGRCRVKLGCSSLWRYPLQHYSEAAMSGCAHVADMPESVDPDFAMMLHGIDPLASDAELISAVEYAEENAERIGSLAQRVAIRNYTVDHYAARLVSEIRESLHVCTL